MRAPLVVVLDLDGTVIGDISTQVCEFELVSALCPAKLRLLKAYLEAQLRHTCLLRPGFARFAKHAAQLEIELFVYTASEARWAQFLVPVVEAAVGVKFNRPIFTRTNCRLVNGSWRKPTKGMLASVHSCVRKRHPGLQTSDLAGRVMFVDNNDVMLQDAAHHVALVHCPTYGARYVHDALRLLPDDLLVQRWRDVARKLMQYGMLDERAAASLASVQAFRGAYYRSLAARIVGPGGSCADDKMWGLFDKILQKYHHKVSPRLVAFINERLNRG